MTTKKSFKRSEPALAFISGASEEKTTPKASKAKKPATKAPEGYKLDPQYVEVKSRRVQLLIQPSLYEAVKAKASSLGISTNEAISEALRAYIEE